MANGVDPRMPVLVGAGQFTHKGDVKACPPVKDMLERVVRAAASDAGLSDDQLSEADSVQVVGFTVDSSPQMRAALPTLNNAPLTLSKAIGALPRSSSYSHMGGNTPQALVNAQAEAIANGEADFSILVGAEYLNAVMKLAGKGEDMSHWADPDADAEAPTRFGDPRDGCSGNEALHGLSFPTNAYPLFENAHRHNLGRSISEHMACLGDLMSALTKVAAANPHAWFPIERSPEELTTVTDKNRMVCYPYPKYLNSIIQVDQAAAVIMMSTAKADELGVAEDKRVYLHGCSDTTELWNPLDRVNYHSSPAIRVGAREALSMANKTVSDLDFFDLYSCFPIAVEFACQEIGIAEDDPRGLTLTGGLPYFGGPGNNYVMHSIAEALRVARAKPGSFGLVTANGWFLTKHAMGIYSTEPVKGAWARRGKSEYQSEIDNLAAPEITEAPNGKATVETYTVVHGREGVRFGIVIGRDSEGRRFVANTDNAPETVTLMETSDTVIGRTGTVTSGEGQKAMFVFDGV